MNKWIISGLLFAAPIVCFGGNAETQEHTFHGSQVHTQDLQKWYKQKKPFVILDARSKPYFDGNVLPNAKWLPYDVNEAALVNAIPSKDSVVVVYCAGPGCPASDWLAARLENMGYTNVYEYPEGITGWTKNGNPTEKA